MITSSSFLASDPNKPYQIQVSRLEEAPAVQRPVPPSSRHVALEASPIPRPREAPLPPAKRLNWRDVDDDPVKHSASKECAMLKELSSHGIRTHKKVSPPKKNVVDTSLFPLVDDPKKAASPVTLSLPARRVPRAPARQPNACWACCLKCLQWLCGRPDP